MNKKTSLSVLVTSLVLIVCSFSVAFAQLHSYGPELNIYDFMDSIAALMWVVFGGIAVIMFVIAGIYFLTAQGNAEKLHTARASLYWGIAGVIVAIVAYSIVSIIAGWFNGNSNGGYYNNNYNSGYNNNGGVNVNAGGNGWSFWGSFGF